MIFVLDNYDSFTYNLVQYIGQLGARVEVARNDRVSVEEIERMSPERIIISPGPGCPGNAGISKEVIARFAGHVPILGVCLGHQCITEVYGGRIVRNDNIMHGKVSRIYHDGDDIFRGIGSPFPATRYHSLIAESLSIKDPLKVIAWTSDKEVMAVRHKLLKIWGVQFHPESILTPDGIKLLRNFMGI